jgi:hypothetical protein
MWRGAAEIGHHSIVQRDEARAAALRDLPPHRQGAGVEIDIFPENTSGLGSSEPTV